MLDLHKDLNSANAAIADSLQKTLPNSDLAGPNGPRINIDPARPNGTRPEILDFPYNDFSNPIGETSGASSTPDEVHTDGSQAVPDSDLAAIMAQEPTVTLQVLMAQDPKF